MNLFRNLLFWILLALAGALLAQLLLQDAPEGAVPEAWLICTRAFQRRYGLGISRPFPVPMGYWLRSGYLKSAQTIPALARACGIDPAAMG